MYSAHLAGPLQARAVPIQGFCSSCTSVRTPGPVPESKSTAPLPHASGSTCGCQRHVGPQLDCCGRTFTRNSTTPGCASVLVGLNGRSQKPPPRFGTRTITCCPAGRPSGCCFCGSWKLHAKGCKLIPPVPSHGIQERCSISTARHFSVTTARQPRSTCYKQ